MALAADGVQPGEVAAILANTRREWSYADYGILLAGGVSSGIYPTDAASQVHYLCADSAARVLFVEDDEQLDKVLEVRDRLPLLSRVVVFDMEGLERLDDPMVMSLEAFEARGAAHDEANPDEFERRLAARSPHDLAILIYTSGTTGKPKGAMLSHRNLCSVMERFAPELSADENDDKMAFLPLCHVAERMVGQFLSLETGARLNYVENPETIAENIREIAPSIILCVPRVWEKFYSAVSIRLREATPLQRWAYGVALSIGYRVADRRLSGQPVGAGLLAAFGLARFLVLNNIRKAIGVNRMRWAISGAAPISPELIRWYHALGVPLYEGWGMSETTAGGSLNLPGAIRLGTIGRPQPWAEMKVSAEGEILIRGDSVFMGYLNQPDKTAEAIDSEGWLHTGDVGTVDEDGFFRITDRMKDIIITAGGKNITPSEIENELKFSPYITDAVVIGDRRAFLTALVMIDHENVERFAQELNVPFTNFQSLCRTREVQELIQGEVDRVNAKFARVEQVKKFRLIEHKLTAEDEELTPTMKLKRKLVNEKYRDLIESMYSAKS
jgi:long-chain acyl-CoA synthetase